MALQTMAIVITEISPAESPSKLNTEWFVLRNEGEKTFLTRGCILEVSRKGSKKVSSLGTMDPGFSLAPGESVRVVTGNPGRKAHGELPSDELRNYNLFLAAPVIKGSGTIVTIRLRQLALASAEYSQDADNGLAAQATAAP